MAATQPTRRPPSIVLDSDGRLDHAVDVARVLAPEFVDAPRNRVLRPRGSLSDDAGQVQYIRPDEAQDNALFTANYPWLGIRIAVVGWLRVAEG